MNAERWRHIEELYQSALEREPDLRNEFLKTACVDDPELLSQVEALLNGTRSAGGANTAVFSASPTVTATAETRVHPGLAGTRLGDRYRVIKELGRGGFATVYLAHDEKLALKPVVIKVLDNLKIDKWRLRKFRQEMEALARIDHPGVIAVLDEGQTSEGTPYLVIQFVDGVTLRHFVKPPGMDLKSAADLIRQIGSALQAAHSKHVLHRDLKPENIMIQTIDGKDRVKLIDFGIASVAGSDQGTTSHSRIAGTQGYMAPEQFEGKPCAESDIFAFGAIAYELLTGQKPIKSPLDLGNMRHGDLKVRPRDLRPEIPESAQAIILKSLSYESSRRYHDAREMADQLADALTPGDRAASSITGSPSDSRLELAHVLFLDLVKYSMMDMETQRKSLDELHQVIGSAPHFVAAESAGELIALPTGDGMALLFFGDPTSAAECAVEIARAAKQRPTLRMRMGLHTGPVYRVADINQRLNAAGGGINMAQRVMDAGDAGQILVSSAVADVLLQLATWKGRLTDLGEHPVKNGVVIHFYNLCTEDAGSAAWPSRLKKPSSKTTRRSVAAAAVIVVLGIGGAFYLIRGSKSSDVTAPASTQASPLQLQYSISAQRYKNGRPFQDSFQLAGEMLFEEDYRIALNVRAPQPGFLYILNEGPLPDGSTSFNVLFPNPGGAAQLNIGQGVRIPQREWFVFDKGYGTEKLYLVWAARAVPEFERAKDMSTVTNGIVVIRDAANVSALQQDLARYLITASDIRKDEGTKTTLLSSKHDVLVHLIRLEHH